MAIKCLAYGNFSASDDTKGKDDGDKKNMVSFTISDYRTCKKGEVSEDEEMYGCDTLYKYRVNLHEFLEAYDEIGSILPKITHMCIYGEGDQDIIEELYDTSGTKVLSRCDDLNHVRIYCPIVRIGDGLFKDSQVKTLEFAYGFLEVGDRAFQNAQIENYFTYERQNLKNYSKIYFPIENDWTCTKIQHKNQLSLSNYLSGRAIIGDSAFENCEFSHNGLGDDSNYLLYPPYFMKAKPKAIRKRAYANCDMKKISAILNRYKTDDTYDLDAETRLDLRNTIVGDQAFQGARLPFLTYLLPSDWTSVPDYTFALNISDVCDDDSYSYSFLIPSTITEFGNKCFYLRYNENDGDDQIKAQSMTTRKGTIYKQKPLGLEPDTTGSPINWLNVTIINHNALCRVNIAIPDSTTSNTVYFENISYLGDNALATDYFKNIQEMIFGEDLSYLGENNFTDISSLSALTIKSRKLELKYDVDEEQIAYNSDHRLLFTPPFKIKEGCWPEVLTLKGPTKLWGNKEISQIGHQDKTADDWKWRDLKQPYNNQFMRLFGEDIADVELKLTLTAAGNEWPAEKWYENDAFHDPYGISLAGLKVTELTIWGQCSFHFLGFLDSATGNVKVTFGDTEENGWYIWRNTWRNSTRYYWVNGTFESGRVLPACMFQHDGLTIDYYIGTTRLKKEGQYIEIEKAGNFPTPFSATGFRDMIIEYPKDLTQLEWPFGDQYSYFTLDKQTNGVEFLEEAFWVRKIIINNFEAGKSLIPYRDLSMTKSVYSELKKPGFGQMFNIFQRTAEKDGDVQYSFILEVKGSENVPKIIPAGPFTGIHVGNCVRGQYNEDTKVFTTGYMGSSYFYPQNIGVYLSLPESIEGIEDNAFGESFGLIIRDLHDVDFIAKPSMKENYWLHRNFWNPKKLAYMDDYVWAQENDSINRIWFNNITYFRNFDTTEKIPEDTRRIIFNYATSTKSYEDWGEPIKELDLTTEKNVVWTRGAIDTKENIEIDYIPDKTEPTYPWHSIKSNCFGASDLITANNCTPPNDSGFPGRNQLLYMLSPKITDKNIKFTHTEKINLTIIPYSQIITSSTYPVLEGLVSFNNLIFKSDGSDNMVEQVFNNEDCLFGGQQGDIKIKITINTLKFDDCNIPIYLLSRESDNIDVLLKIQLANNSAILSRGSLKAIKVLPVLELSNQLVNIEDCFNKGIDINTIKYHGTLADWGTKITSITKGKNPMQYCRHFLSQPTSGEDNLFQYEFVTGFSENSSITPHAYEKNYFINSIDFSNVVGLGEDALSECYALYEIYNIAEGLKPYLPPLAKKCVKSTTISSKYTEDYST